MKLIGRLKEDVENATNKAEAMGILRNAGVELTADELDSVTGGISVAISSQGMNPSADHHTPVAHFKCKVCKIIFSGNGTQCYGCGNNDLNKIEFLYIK